MKQTSRSAGKEGNTDLELKKHQLDIFLDVKLRMYNEASKFYI